MAPDDITILHGRLDSLFKEIATVGKGVALVSQQVATHGDDHISIREFDALKTQLNAVAGKSREIEGIVHDLLTWRETVETQDAVDTAALDVKLSPVKYLAANLDKVFWAVATVAAVTYIAQNVHH